MNSFTWENFFTLKLTLKNVINKARNNGLEVKAKELTTKRSWD